MATTKRRRPANVISLEDYKIRQAEKQMERDLDLLRDSLAELIAEATRQALEKPDRA